MREDERDLEEVERALSVLGGRHPDQVRAERLASEAAAKRRREHEKELEAARRSAWKRRVLAVVALGAVASVALVAWRIFSVRSAADQSVAPLVARYVALGFDALPRPAFAPQDVATVPTVAGDCYAFVATNGALKIERANENVSSADTNEALVCTCASETITVSSTEKNSVVRALHIAGAALGGSRAAVFRFGERAPKFLGGDDACADDMLASFARARSREEIPKANLDGAWLASHPSLASRGFTTLVSAPKERPFAFAPPRGASCFIAAGAARDELTLWALDASAFQKPIEHASGAIAWCAEKEATFVVEHDVGNGAVTVVAAPAARVGGMLGLREIARAENIAARTWNRDDERGALAMDTLRASVVPDPQSAGCESIDPAHTKNARVLVFASDGPTFSTTDLDVRCVPALGAPESLCVEARALAWRAPPPKSASEAGTCAVAYGPLPYWMSAVSEPRDTPAASELLLDQEIALIAFARKLAARGFFPGVIEGVTEKSDSVEILGRSGDDAIVAVGLWPLAPYVHPYSDAAPWTLDGEPRVIPVKGGERVTLRVPNGNVAIDKRRTVVFRHSQSQAIH